MGKIRGVGQKAYSNKKKKLAVINIVAHSLTAPIAGRQARLIRQCYHRLQFADKEVERQSKVICFFKPSLIVFGETFWIDLTVRPIHVTNIHG